MPNIFDIPMPEMDQAQTGGVPQMGLMPISQPPVASPQEMALANLFRQQMPNPEDDELKRLREREDAIYERIMKGPRARAKELTAELWKERYGITEKSGKLARIFAGIGEIGRAGGGGKSYVSIPDQARELAMKEYQTEVGPLQREASVLSSAQKAAKAQADLTRYRNEQLLKDWYIQQRKLGQTDERIAITSGMSKAQIDKIKADIGWTEAKTNLTNEQVDAAQQQNALTRYFGGAKPTGTLANAFALNNLGNQDPGQANDVVGAYNLLGGGRTGSSGTGEKQTVRIQTTRPIVSYDAEQRPHVVQAPIERVFRENIPGSAAAGAKPSWFQASPEQNAVKSVAPVSVSYQQLQPEKNGKEFRFTDIDGEQRNLAVRPGNVATERVDPTHIDNLSKRFGVDPKAFNGFRSRRFTDWVGPAIKEPTERASAKSAYYTSLAQLTRDAVNAYASHNDENISGLYNTFDNNIKAFAGDLPPEAIAIRQSAVDTIATRILELSGKAVTNQERALYMKALPNLTTDAPSTFVAKSMILKHMLDTRKMFAEGRMTDAEIDKFYSTTGGQRLAKMAEVQFDLINRFRESAANGKPFVLGNKTYTNLDEGAKALKATMSRETMNKYFKQGLKEAGITDVIPLN